MSDTHTGAAALLRRGSIELGDGLYLERSDPREGKFEDFLRGVVAKFPRPDLVRWRLKQFVAAVNAREAQIRVLGDAALPEQFRAACRDMRARGFEDIAVSHAFAVVREVSRRVLGMRHHDVQLIGGWALLQGRIAEMATGEGKTLVATLAACTAAGAGASVHVVTVNDYLATRDAANNTPLYQFLGLTVGAISGDIKPEQRREQYARDIVYVSNKEVVFDYLKDRLAAGGLAQSRLRLRKLRGGARTPAMLLRGLHVAIVDEADSVLIDEARTPLIISETEEPGEEEAALFSTAVRVARELESGRDFEISAHRDIRITDRGSERSAEATRELGGVWRSATWRHELIEKALSALHAFHRDQHYIVADGKVQIVDEFTGRVMPDRSWERGLHQMIEAKEGCKSSGQRRTLSRMTYQRFFRRYLLLGGMTGTAAEVRAELRRVYSLDVLKIPTHKPSRRRRLGNRCWADSDSRWNAVADRALEISRLGRAVLVGTRSVEASEQLAGYLEKRGADFRVLNARQDGEEAAIVADAGQPGRITVATNMAGRGTDIKLAHSVSELGGLHVILTEFHESARIDRQLFGRSARQGEAGTVEALVCLQDEVFSRHVPAAQALYSRLLRGQEVPPLLAYCLVRLAQTVAERHNARIRLDTLAQDKKLQAQLAFAGDPN
jgi:preprotein translocase subunit SecA